MCMSALTAIQTACWVYCEVLRQMRGQVQCSATCFPHVSVREYLERSKYSLEQAHEQVAVTCLISLRDPQCYVRNSRWRERTIFGYSLLFWIAHAAAVASQHRSDLLQLLYNRYISRNEKCSIMDWLDWLKFALRLRPDGVPDQIRKMLRHSISISLNPLFPACVWGLIDMIPKVSLTSAGLKEMNEDGYSGLILASWYGHDHIVSLLIEKGAQIDAHSNGKAMNRYPIRAKNALQAACLGGHGNIMRYLLDNGAEINAQGGIYGNALQAASIGANENIVQVLLDNGADVDAQGGEYGNALQAASKRSHAAIVQLLLGHGAVKVEVPGYWMPAYKG